MCLHVEHFSFPDSLQREELSFADVWQGPVSACSLAVAMPLLASAAKVIPQVAVIPKNARAKSAINFFHKRYSLGAAIVTLPLISQ